MDYEIVKLEKKTVVGLSARTNNNSPEMGMVIGGLWQRFYQDGIYESIQNKKNDKSLGIYTEYAGEVHDDYSILTACEVESADAIPQDTVKLLIPESRYAKFIVKGDMQKAVADFWCELWKMDLARSFVCDFEEYQNGDMENAVIHVYISLK